MKHGSSFTDFKEIGDLKSYFSLLISTHCFSDYVNFVLRGTSIGLRYKTQKQWAKWIGPLTHTDYVQTHTQRHI